MYNFAVLFRKNTVFWQYFLEKVQYFAQYCETIFILRFEIPIGNKFKLLNVNI
jgi:hypothetical protein